MLSDSAPDWQGIEEARIVASGSRGCRRSGTDGHWHLYELTDPEPMADPPATVARADDGELDINVPSGGWVLVRVPWSPWLGVRGGPQGCLSQAGDWTRLYAPVAGPLPPRRQLPAPPWYALLSRRSGPSG